jgi:hypothetical protein
MVNSTAAEKKFCTGVQELNWVPHYREGAITAILHDSHVVLSRELLPAAGCVTTRRLT